MKFLQNVKVFQKVLLLGVIIIAAFTVLLAAYIYPIYKNNMFAAKKEQTKNMVNSASAIVEHYVELEKSGQLTKEAAQTAAMDAVRYMRYDNGNYFWINDLTPKLVMHPTVSATDKPDFYKDGGMKNYVDPTGIQVVVELNKIAVAHGEGSMDYQWPKPGEEDKPPAPKISYVKLIPDWDWVVGTGVYVDDVQKQVNTTIFGALLMVLGIIGVSVLIAILLANSIAKPLRTITAVASRLSEGDISDNVKMDRKDEVGILADAFAKMIDYQRAVSNVADQMAVGDLTAIIQPKSEKDRLGNSFVQMLASLRDAVSQVSQNAASLDEASDELSQAATQAAQATSQIASTIQQVANGSSVQAGAITKTASAVDQMTQAINGCGKRRSGTKRICVQGIQRDGSNQQGHFCRWQAMPLLFLLIREWQQRLPVKVPLPSSKPLPVCKVSNKKSVFLLIKWKRWAAGLKKLARLLKPLKIYLLKPICWP